MNPIVKTFTQKIIQQYQTGHAREHAYRPALEVLFEEITGLSVVNDPKRSENGAPDFVFLKGNIVIAYAEAKDITVNLAEVERGEQMKRYYGYSNLILTNGLDFRFYKSGEKYCEPIIIGKIKNEQIELDESTFQLLADTIGDFIKSSKEPIKSGLVLAKIMAGKARRIRDNVNRFLADENDIKSKELFEIFQVIKRSLLAELDKEKFADMYAQTLVYGLFVARYYDETSETFSRQEARDLVPASNPFLRNFFDHIAGSSFDKRIEMIVDELCEEFTHADVKAIVHNYYKVEKDSSRDPIIHFYEDFLQAYDQDERKKMGVFYTPLPVVRFIVRAVDDILKKEFDLPQGLTDSSKIKIEMQSQAKKFKGEVHRVQILDPATGTGTFLNEVILHIKKSFEGQEGRWSSYVNKDLLPRLHGFELMMASYTIAHLKLSTTIMESGAKIEDTRLNVYLTNSLEKTENEKEDLFSFGLGKAITDESFKAAKVKNELPIMVVIGNPPYSGISQNKNYTDNEVYKVEPGGLERLKEKKNWLDDDYVKFIRLAESLIEKNGEGVVAMITSHGYVENPTFRGMRWHLRNTFDAIYILDLHGNSNKKETTLNGGIDENVFNIKTGVSIIFGVKKQNRKNKKLAQVYKYDFYGLREEKFAQLNNSSLDNIKWLQIPENNDIWKIEGRGKSEYKKGFSINDMFTINTTGIVTARDGLVISEDKDDLINRMKVFCDKSKSDKEIRELFFGHKKSGKYLAGDSRGWKLEKARNKIESNDHKLFVKNVLYRPFDLKYLYYTPDMVDWGRWDIMQNFINKDNVGLVVPRFSKNDWGVLCVSMLITHKVVSAYDSNSIFPLYLYSDDGTKTPNLKPEIVAEIENIVGKTQPEDILDYIYAVLHSPKYREKYKEFLKIDFPCVPYPQDKKIFWALVKLGTELRNLHLLESPKVNQFITTFPKSGTDTVEKSYPKFIEHSQCHEKLPGKPVNLEGAGIGDVFINDEQYFGNVPKVAWEFYIGGYQPAQKWLKDRRGRQLTNEDIEHYQKFIVALVETSRIMGEVDEVMKF
jgi:predicted helicase